jgi:hypothetical protein
LWWLFFNCNFSDLHFPEYLGLPLWATMPGPSAILKHAMYEEAPSWTAHAWHLPLHLRSLSRMKMYLSLSSEISRLLWFFIFIYLFIYLFLKFYSHVHTFGSFLPSSPAPFLTPLSAPSLFPHPLTTRQKLFCPYL